MLIPVSMMITCKHAEREDRRSPLLYTRAHVYDRICNLYALMTEMQAAIFFFNDTATTEIYTLFPTRRSSDLLRRHAVIERRHHDHGNVHHREHVHRHPDRKSTRLNSSHVRISYAVFCLKKKKKKKKKKKIKKKKKKKKK